MIADRWKNALTWWRIWRVPATVAVALALLWLLRSPILSRVSIWRAEAASAEAQELADAGNWKAAEEEARRALQLDRKRYDALCILMEASFRNSRADTLRLAAAVFSHPESEPVDQARALDLVLLAGDYVGFRRLIAGLSSVRRMHPDIYLQETRYYSRRGEHDLALKRLETVPRGPDESLVLLIRAETLMGAHRFREAQKVIATMAVGKNSTPPSRLLAALRLIGTIPLSDLDSTLSDFVRKLINSLDRSLIGANERLLLDSIALAGAGNSPTRREQVIIGAVATYAASDPEALGNWLFSIGEGTRFAGMITEETALASEPLFFLRLRSLTASDDWLAAKRWLAQAGSGLDSTRVEVSRAITARRLGENSEATARWRSALHAASIVDSGNVYWKLGSLAMAHKEWDWAAEAVLMASKDPSALLPPAADLVILVDALARRDQLADAIKLTVAWIAREPENPALYSNLLYFSLLAGTPVEGGTEKAKKLSQTFPGMNVFLGTYALALLLDDHENEARTMLGDKTLDWKVATPTTRAIRARLEAGPDRKPDFPDAATLYPAERRLLGFE